MEGSASGVISEDRFGDVYDMLQMIEVEHDMKAFHSAMHQQTQLFMMFSAHKSYLRHIYEMRRLHSYAYNKHLYHAFSYPLFLKIRCDTPRLTSTLFVVFVYHHYIYLMMRLSSPKKLPFPNDEFILCMTISKGHKLWVMVELFELAKRFE